MRYRVTGSGPGIVLVPGFGVGSRYMMPLAEQLSRDFRVYAPDLPGFGESSKPAEVLNVPGLAIALRRWISEIGLEKPALIGNSLGCQIIVRLLEAEPAAASCAVLQGPTLDPTARSAVRQASRLLRDIRHESPSLIPIVVRDYLRAGPRRILRTMQHMLADEIETALPHVTTPTLVIRGSLDVVVPERWAREMADRLPNAEYQPIPGAPHAANFSSPLELARVARPFLNRHLGLFAEVPTGA